MSIVCLDKNQKQFPPQISQNRHKNFHDFPEHDCRKQQLPQFLTKKYFRGNEKVDDWII